MNLLALVVITIIPYSFVSANFTKMLPQEQRHIFLSRRKRYLTFPMGSNFVITLSALKLVMQAQPIGWQIVLECDVPFPLPSDTRIFDKQKRHAEDRLEVYRNFEAALKHQGFNGRACVKRMICEAEQYVHSKGKSLVTDLLYSIFTTSEGLFGSNVPYSEWKCEDSNLYEECSESIIDFILKSVSGNI